VKHSALIIDGRVMVLQAALDWESSAEAIKFSKMKTVFVETVRKLGLIDNEMGAETGTRYD
jgi:coenzyme F420-reducing hydrogenase delta subunit